MDDLRDLLRRAAGDGPARFGSSDVARRVRRRRAARRAGGAGAVTLLVAMAGVLLAAGMGGDGGQVADEDGLVPSEEAFCDVLGTDLVAREWGDTDLVVLVDPSVGGPQLAGLADEIRERPEVASARPVEEGESHRQFEEGFSEDDPDLRNRAMLAFGPDVMPPSIRVELSEGVEWDGRELLGRDGVEAVVDVDEAIEGEMELVVDATVRVFVPSFQFGTDVSGTVGAVPQRGSEEILGEALAAAPSSLRDDVRVLYRAVSDWRIGSIAVTPERQAAAERIAGFYDTRCGGSDAAFCDVLRTDVVTREWGDTDVVVPLEPGADASTAAAIADEISRLPGVASAEATPMSVARQRYLDLRESAVESPPEVDDDEVPLTIEVELEPGVTEDLDAIDQLPGVQRAYPLDQRFPNGPRLVDVHLRPLTVGNVAQWTGWRALATDVRPLVDAAPTGLADEAGVVLGAVRDSTTGPDDLPSDEVVRAARRIVAFHDTECVDGDAG